MRLKILMLAALATTAALSGCSPRVKAPTDLGVCYFIGHPMGADGKTTLKFNPIARDQPDIEHCAVQLYNARMGMLTTNTAGKVTEGSYQGNFLFVTNGAVDFSQTYEGPTFPLLVKAPDGRLVQPGSVVIEDDDTPSRPETVAIPKNLPKGADLEIGQTLPPVSDKTAPAKNP